MTKILPLLFCFVLAITSLSAQRIDTDKLSNTRQYIDVYNAKNEKTSRTYREFNRGMWLNKEKITYSYDKNTNETSELAQCWYNNNWVNVNLKTYTYDTHNVQTGYTQLLWNGAQWLPPSSRPLGGLFYPRDHVKWKNNDNSFSSGILLSMGGMGNCSIKPDADTGKIIFINFHALQPVDTVEAKNESGEIIDPAPKNSFQLRPPAFAGQNGFTNKAEAKNVTVKGLKVGKWVEYYHFIVLEHGDPYEYLTTDTNALYYKLTIYKKGKPDGIVRTYSAREKALYTEAPYEHGKLNGLFRMYDVHNGQLIIEFPYTDSLINGIGKTYFSHSGNLQSETPYKDGKENGIARQYAETGELTGTISYKDGKFDGMRYTYYKSGKVMSETPYTAERMHPEIHLVPPERLTRMQKEYYANPFSGLLINGMEKHYYENGNLESETPYEDGLIWEGVAKEFYQDGKLRREATYSQGKMIESKRYDESGNEIPVQPPPQNRPSR